MSKHMRVGPLSILLLLAACDSQADREPSVAPTSLPPGASSATAADATAGPDQLQARAKTSLAVLFPNQDDMRFGNLRAGTANAVCGEVEAKQLDGKRGVRPFVITPEGVAVVSTTPQVQITDPEDPFPDFYIRWCASPAELARLQPNMVGGETLGLGAALPPNIPDVPPDLPVDVPIPPAPEPQPERPAAQVKAEPPPRPPAPTADDSFFNAVARPTVKDGQ